MRTLFLLAVMLMVMLPFSMAQAYTSQDRLDFLTACEKVVDNAEEISPTLLSGIDVLGYVELNDILHAETLIRIRAKYPKALSYNTVINSITAVYSLNSNIRNAELGNLLKQEGYDAEKAVSLFYIPLGGGNYTWASKTSSMDNSIKSDLYESIFKEQIGNSLTQIIINTVSAGTNTDVLEIRNIPVEDFHAVARQLLQVNEEGASLVQAYTKNSSYFRSELYELRNHTTSYKELISYAKERLVHYPANDTLLAQTSTGERVWKNKDTVAGYVPCLEFIPMRTWGLGALSYDVTYPYYVQHINFLKKESVDIISKLNEETHPSQVKKLCNRFKRLSEYSDYAPFNYNKEYGLMGNPQIYAKYSQYETFYDKNVRYAMSAMSSILESDNMPSTGKLSDMNSCIEALFNILPLPSKM